MCILFLHTSKNPENGQYKLILASNRDEFYNRLSSTAHFWSPENSDILGGQDLEPEKEGGTWLALSKTGKIGALLNILAPKCEQKQGRGFLVKEFLQFQDSAELEFSQQLKENASKYDPFSLIMINVLSPNGPTINYFTNATCTGVEYPIELTSNNDDCNSQRPGKFYGFGNSSYNTPFQKVQTGKEKLIEIVGNFNNDSDKGKLIQELLSLLRNEEKNYPDPQLSKQGSHVPEPYLPQLSRRFIRAPGLNYGTRVQTIILVDHNNAVEFHEWSLETPVNPESLKWIHSSFEFTLN